MTEKGIKIIAENRKARHDYFILDTFEVGLVLTGTEVKSLRAGKVNLKDSYAQVVGGEMILQNMHISPYEQGNRYNVDPMRPRKLLMHKREIMRLLGRVKQEGLTMVPLKIYFTRGMVKMELALCKGKKLFDKREASAAKDVKREIAREFRGKA